MTPLIDASPFDSCTYYAVPGNLMTNLWIMAQRAGNYGLTHDQNRDFQNLMALVRHDAVALD